MSTIKKIIFLVVKKELEVSMVILGRKINICGKKMTLFLKRQRLSPEAIWYPSLSFANLVCLCVVICIRSSRSGQKGDEFRERIPNSRGGCTPVRLMTKMLLLTPPAGALLFHKWSLQSSGSKYQGCYSYSLGTEGVGVLSLEQHMDSPCKASGPAVNPVTLP